MVLLKREPRANRPSRQSSPITLASPLLLFYTLFLVIPVGYVVFTSFRTYNGPFINGGFAGFENYAHFLSSPGQASVIVRTFKVAISATILCILIGYPTAYFTVRFPPRLRSLVIVILIAPMLSSVVARVFGWKTILGPGALGDWIGGLFGRESLLLTESAIVIALANVLLPFMVLPLLTAMQSIDPSLRRAAGSLGASPLRTLLHVDLPLSLQGLVGGTVIVMSLSLGSFVEASLLGGSRNSVVATAIYQDGTVYYNAPLSAAGSVLLAVTTFCLVAINLRSTGGTASRRLAAA
jgi:putative spermidine/putrescine transport system permease protein